MAEEIFNEDERDVLGETINIAMGKAGAALAQAFEGFVNLQVPEIRSVSAADLLATRNRLGNTYERIEKHNLSALNMRHTQDPRPGGLWLVGNNRDLFFQQTIEERRFPDIRPSDDGHTSKLHGVLTVGNRSFSPIGAN